MRPLLAQRGTLRATIQSSFLAISKPPKCCRIPGTMRWPSPPADDHRSPPPSCRAALLVCGAHRTSKHGAGIHAAGRRIGECGYAGPAVVHQLRSLSVVDRAVLGRAYCASVSGFSSWIFWSGGPCDPATERTFRWGSRGHDMEFAIMGVVLTGSRGVSVCSWSVFPVPPPPTAGSVRSSQISSRERRTHAALAPPLHAGPCR